MDKHEFKPLADAEDICGHFDSETSCYMLESHGVHRKPESVDAAKTSLSNRTSEPRSADTDVESGAWTFDYLGWFWRGGYRPAIFRLHEYRRHLQDETNRRLANDILTALNERDALLNVAEAAKVLLDPRVSYIFRGYESDYAVSRLRAAVAALASTNSTEKNNDKGR